MAREYFKAFHSYLQSMEPLNDAERGRLFTALLEYSNTGTEPELRGNERFVFPTIRAAIERDIEIYESQCKKNASNGKKGGRPPKPNETQKTQVVIEKPNETQKSQELEELEELEDKDKRHKELIVHFWETIWALYPEKKGKGQVSDTQKAKLFKIGAEHLARCIERYKANKQDWQKWQNGSTFFNSGYVDYLDENYSATVTPPEGRRYKDFV